MRRHLFLGNFKVLRPNFEAKQSTILDWIIEAHTHSERERMGWKSDDPNAKSFSAELKMRLYKIGLGEDKIKRRGFHLDDCTHNEWGRMDVYNVEHAPEGYHLDRRMAFFDKAISEVFDTFYPEGSPLPAHLIHTTCTGYVAPSPAQRLVSNRENGSQTMVTHAYHMGCYASIPSIRMAMGHCAVEGSSTEVVHTEFSSIHMNPSSHTTEQLIIQSLFADGSIKYSVGNEEEGPCYEIVAVHEELVGKSLSKMTWTCHNWGFHMSISKDIPVLIRRSLMGFLENLMKKAKVDKAVLDRAHFAIHPGGVKIIEQTAQALGLSAQQVLHSHQVMQDYGNMSSATLPHVWDRMLSDDAILPGEPIIGMAFGPGLNISGILMVKR